MKKCFLMLCAAVACFMMASCDSKSSKETMMKEADDFFTQAETKVNAIGNVEDFWTYYTSFEKERESFAETLFAKNSNEDGTPKGITEEEAKEVIDYMYDRATAYNKVEGAKYAEVIEPLLARMEKAVDNCYSKIMNGEEMSEDDDLEVEESYEEYEPYSSYDNVIPEVRERFESLAVKLQEIMKDGEDYGDIEEEE